MSTTNKLSTSAEEIFKNVMSALQNADEMGGTRNHLDYRNLMEKIIDECHRRQMNSYDVEAAEELEEAEGT
jgi:thiamine biosynthesis protein ThiC